MIMLRVEIGLGIGGCKDRARAHHWLIAMKGKGGGGKERLRNVIVFVASASMHRALHRQSRLTLHVGDEGIINKA